jgi:hypothetical protein
MRWDGLFPYPCSGSAIRGVQDLDLQEDLTQRQQVLEVDFSPESSVCGG